MLSNLSDAKLVALWKEKEAEQNEIWNEMYLRYTPLMYKLTANKPHNGIFDRDDLLSTSAMSIHSAVSSYDETKGSSFLTWLYGEMTVDVFAYVLQNKYAFSISKYGALQLRKYQRELGEFAREHNRFPTWDELKELTGISKKLLLTLAVLSEHAVPLDECVDDLRCSTTMEHNNAKDLVDACSRYLSEREMNILLRHCGLDRGGNMDNIEPLAEIARSLMISKDTAKKIYDDSVNKLRMLQEFIDWR